MEKKKYTKEFKLQAVLLSMENHSPTKSALSLGIPKKTLEKWITSYYKDNNIFNDGYESPEVINRRILKENRELKESLEILKKIIAFLR